MTIFWSTTLVVRGIFPNIAPHFRHMFFQELYTALDIYTGVLSVLMLLTLITLLFYNLGIYLKIGKVKETEKLENKSGVSVIICAKNECENLKKNLPAFLQQDYPEYEVIVVNDASSDESENLLAEFKVKYPKLKYTNIPLNEKFAHGKKLAVTVGIKAAQYEQLLFSDADCYPQSDQWIKKTAANFSKEKEIVLGIGKYERKKGLLNVIVRYETLFTAIQYISYAIKGKAFMGVGRNLAYKKELFYKHKGFAKHLNVLSGDDDLFVNQAATKTNTSIEISPDSHTISSAPVSFGKWLKQKKRHLSTAKYYSKSSSRRLGIEYFCRFSFYASFIALLFFDWYWMLALGAYIIYAISRLLMLKMAMKRLNEWDLLVPSLVLDLLLPIILGVVRMTLVIRPQRAQWN